MARKYSAIHRVGASVGFVSPRVLMVKKDHILLERIHNIVSLRELYISNDAKTLDAVVRRAGEVLASIHVNLPRSTGIIWAAPPGFETDLQRYMFRKIDLAQLPLSILHGDYGFSNVFVSTNSEKSIVIIDPCPNFGSTFHEWALAPSYLDVGKMFACLEGQIPVRYQRRRPKTGRVSDLQAIFMGGYEQLGDKLDVELANGFAFAVASAQFRRRFGKFGMLRQAVLYNRVRGNFPLSAKIKLRAKFLR